jgi:hypothetical protein
METYVVTLLNGVVGILIGAFVMARRDLCAETLRDVCAIPARWSPFVAGIVTGTGLSILVAATWTIHCVWGGDSTDIAGSMSGWSPLR